MKEIRRRTRVVGAFPDGNSALMLVGARLRHITTTKWDTKPYLATCNLYEEDVFIVIDELRGAPPSPDLLLRSYMVGRVRLRPCYELSLLVSHFKCAHISAHYPSE